MVENTLAKVTPLRAASMTATQRASLRESIPAQKILHSNMAIAQALTRGVEPAEFGDGRPENEGDPSEIYLNPLTNRYERLLTKERATQLKMAADVNMKMLGKVLPDLRATEITGKDGSEFERAPVLMTELANRLRIFSNELQSTTPVIIDNDPKDNGK